MQNIDASQPIIIKQSNLNQVELEKYNVEFVKPFNFRKGWIYRMEILTIEQDVYLLIDVHYLIFNWGSFDLFLNQFVIWWREK